MIISICANAESGQTATQRFTLYYNHSEISIAPDYLGNKAQMDTICRYLAKSPKIDSITIYAYASPEGSFQGNSLLAEKRAEAAREFILSHLAPGATEPVIILKAIPENWEGLYRKVHADYHRHDRDKVLKILENGNISDATRKWRLQRLDNGATWRHLINNHMPELRTATWVCTWIPPKPEIRPCPEILAAAPPCFKKGILQPVPLKDEPEKEKVHILSLKTNLLYDAVTALNAEVEVPVGNRFSIAVEDVFPWWSAGPNGKKYAFQIWEMGIEPRWWFRRQDRANRLQGHFAGAYAMSGVFDFQNDTRLCHQGDFWSAGLTYGYSMPLGRNFSMEFSLSLGYLSLDYSHYQPSPDYSHLFLDRYNTGNISYFGPTKLKITFGLPVKASLKKRK